MFTALKSVFDFDFLIRELHEELGTKISQSVFVPDALQFRQPIFLEICILS